MKKILAFIVEYKLNKNNLNQLLDNITQKIDLTSFDYPDSFRNKVQEVISDIKNFTGKDPLSSKEEELLMAALKEMEFLIVDYLSLKSKKI